MDSPHENQINASVEENDENRPKKKIKAKPLKFTIETPRQKALREKKMMMELESKGKDTEKNTKKSEDSAEIKKSEAILKGLERSRVEDKDSVKIKKSEMESKDSSSSSIRVTRPPNPTSYKTPRVYKGGLTVSLMCHQCQRSDKEKIVRCKDCDKRYCAQCIRTWYPLLSEEDVEKRCPYCNRNCNCKACMRNKKLHEELKDARLNTTESEKVVYARHLIHSLLPLLKEIIEEQSMELMVEAGIKGL